MDGRVTEILTEDQNLQNKNNKYRNGSRVAVGHRRKWGTIGEKINYSGSKMSGIRGLEAKIKSANKVYYALVRL